VSAWRFMLATLVALVALLAVAGPAGAAGPSLADSLAIADRWAANAAPGHANHCSAGRLRISFAEDPRLADGGPAVGLAYGWAWNGREFVWDTTRCVVTIRAWMTPLATCVAIAHELMHFVIGPEHVGPLDPAHPGPRECYDAAQVPARRVSGRRARRLHRELRPSRSPASPSAAVAEARR
jgi:hypothetical protein